MITGDSVGGAVDVPEFVTFTTPHDPYHMTITRYNKGVICLQSEATPSNANNISKLRRAVKELDCHHVLHVPRTLNPEPRR